MSRATAAAMSQPCFAVLTVVRCYMNAADAPVISGCRKCASVWSLSIMVPICSALSPVVIPSGSS